jgi:transposase
MDAGSESLPDDIGELKAALVVARAGRICLSNNAAERGVRGIALGRKSWLFCGSDRGGERAAVMYSLIVTAKMNDVDPQAWLADVLARIAEHPAQKLDELLPWNWRLLRELVNQAA